jgi:hypothetical protein
MKSTREIGAYAPTDADIDLLSPKNASRYRIPIMILPVTGEEKHDGFCAQCRTHGKERL